MVLIMAQHSYSTVPGLCVATMASRRLIAALATSSDLPRALSAWRRRSLESFCSAICSIALASACDMRSREVASAAIRLWSPALGPIDAIVDRLAEICEANSALERHLGGQHVARIVELDLEIDVDGVGHEADLRADA